jgi:hypothetical protein
MNILDLIMNKPIEKLTVKDLQRMYKAGYITVGELKEINTHGYDERSYDIAIFMLQFPNKYEVGRIEMEYINYVYGATGFNGDLEAIADAKSLIVKGLQKLAEHKQVCMNELIIRLQQDYR